MLSIFSGRKKAKVGVIVHNTENKSRDFGEYSRWAGKLLVKDGDKVITWQLTEADIAKFNERSKNNPEDALKY